MKELHLNRPGAIGDIIMTLQAIDKYKKLNPDDRIVYYCDPSWMGIPAICPAVDEVRSSADFDINAPGAQNLYGYTEIPLRKHLTWYFGKELGLNDTFYNYGFKPIFKLSKNIEFSLLLQSRKKIITLHCNAGWSPYKNWNINNWQEIINRLNIINPDNYRIVQIGLKGEKVLENITDMVGKLNVVESVELIKHAALHLGVDSFSNHVTALLPHTPSIILWGSTHPGIFGYGHNVNIWKPLHCSPCNKLLKDKCPTEPHPCMSSITVDEVFNAILKQLGE
jgi:ADP-heptose:LPS heptosyltransferase